MSQSIWDGTRGGPLEFTYTHGNFSRLALHVEVIYFLVVPLYALFPDPRTLLILQAVLFTLGALPVYRMAHRHFDDRWLARALMLCYLLYPTAQTAVLFDFHGDTLAMPLLIFVLDALDRRDWQRYALWVGLALLCKFYVAIPLSVLGAVLWLQGRRRVGTGTILASMGWGASAFFVIRTLFTPSDAFQAQAAPLNYFAFYFGHIPEVLLPTALPRLMNLFIVLAPALWLGWRAVFWLLPALAIILPALFSVGDVSAYDYRFHHYAITVPFLLYAVLLGAEKLRRRAQSAAAGERVRNWRAEIFFTLVLIVLFNVGLVDTPLNPRYWMALPGAGRDQWCYGVTSRDQLKDRWLADNVPAGDALAASEFMAPHLTNRETLYLVRYPDELKSLNQYDHQSQSRYLLAHPDSLDELLLHANLAQVDYVAADALFDYANPFAEGQILGGVLYDIPGVMEVLNSPDFGLRATRDGLLLFERGLPAAQALSQEVAVLTPSVEPQIKARFGDKLGLVSASVQPLGGRRYRLQYEWWPLRPLAAEPPFIAVSRLAGVPHSRYVHLPTVALHPTVRWEPGQLVRETFEIKLPPDLASGSYQLQVGWYDSSEPYAFETDERSRLGMEVLIEALLVK